MEQKGFNVFKIFLNILNSFPISPYVIKYKFNTITFLLIELYNQLNWIYIMYYLSVT